MGEVVEGHCDDSPTNCVPCIEFNQEYQGFIRSVRKKPFTSQMETCLHFLDLVAQSSFVSETYFMIILDYRSLMTVDKNRK